MNNLNMYKTPCTVYKVKSKDCTKPCLSNMKYHVFISKTTTQELAEYITSESWGNNNVLLYKYLDYIWRFQLIDKQVKQFSFHGRQRLIFHTGLQRRIDGKDVYLCLVPNNAYSKKRIIQEWRVALGFGIGNNESFATKQDLIKYYKISERDIPMKTNFVKSKTDKVFQKDYSFIIDWQERIRTAKNRISEALSNDIGFKGNLSLQKTKNMVKQATKVALAMARKNPNSIGKQVFIEREIIDNQQVTLGYHLELLLPLTLTIDNKQAYFAMVLRVDHDCKQYEGMSILTREMAYTNARLLGPVKLPWLTPFIYSNKLENNIAINNIINNSISTINIPKTSIQSSVPSSIPVPISSTISIPSLPPIPTTQNISNISPKNTFYETTQLLLTQQKSSQSSVSTSINFNTSPCSSSSNTYIIDNGSTVTLDLSNDKSSLIAPANLSTNNTKFIAKPNNNTINNYNNTNNNNNNNNNIGLADPLFYLATTLPLTLPVTLPKVSSLPQSLPYNNLYKPCNITLNQQIYFPTNFINCQQQ